MRRKTRKDFPALKASDEPLFAVLTPERIEWFWSKVDRSGGEDSCHPWTGNLQTDGYGQAQWSHNYRRFAFVVHHMAWALTHGVDPAMHDHVVRRTCGNRRCCNARHLVLSTQREVAADLHRRAPALSSPAPEGV